MRGGCWGPATQPPGHPATPPPSQPRNKSESNIHRTKKKKTPETKGRWDNLRKAVQKKTNLRPAFISNNKPLCVIYLGAGLQGPRKSQTAKKVKTSKQKQANKTNNYSFPWVCQKPFLWFLFVCLFVLFFPEAGLLCVTLESVLELTLQTRLVSNSQRSTCFCLLSAGIKCVCHQCPARPIKMDPEVLIWPQPSV